MSKSKKPEQPDPPREAAAKTTIKIDVDLHRTLRTIAGHRGIELADLVNQMLRPQADAMIAEVVEEIRRRRSGGGR